MARSPFTTGTRFVGIPLYDMSGSIVAWAKVDPEDAGLAQYDWWLSNGYAKRREGPHVIYIHRQLLELTGELYADHINRDRLDNRRVNLRVVTKAQNAQNVTTRPHSSRFRGVSRDPRGGWIARAKLGGKHRQVGRYEYEEQAARAIQEWRRKHMPFAEDEAA